MKLTCGILDYGVGNLGSVRRALEEAGARTLLVKDGDGAYGVDVLVLPGVGAFGAAMSGLTARGSVAAIHQRVREGKPLLGICLGMHLLFEGSEESAGVAGLDLFPGAVRRLQHGSRIGWETLRPNRNADSVISGAAVGHSFFFCHNYYLPPSSTAHTLLVSGDEEPTVAVLQKGNIVGLQFHPERSQMSGLKLLQEMLRAWGARG